MYGIWINKINLKILKISLDFFSQVKYNISIIRNKKKGINNMNKIEFKKQIKEIRELLKANNILEATYKMIDLNRYNIDIDYYTQYFISSIDIDIPGDEKIMVEAVLSGFVEASAMDIEDTLKEIEEKFLK